MAASGAAGRSVRGALRRGLGTAMKAAAAGADIVRPPGPGLIVLIYHRVGGRSGSQVDLPAAQFEEQIAELAEDGRLVSLDRGIDLVSESGGDRADEVRHPVALTFDDGTADWVDEVLPILARYRAPATFYVATDFVERGRPFPGDGPPVTWGGLAELVSSGLATIGSHTHSHALLDRADLATAARELRSSRDLIGDRLGIGCEHFAYPKALLGPPTTEDEVRRLFRSAALAGSRVNPFGATDLHRLRRTPVQVSDGMRWFRRKVVGGLHLENSARSILNRRRYAGATT